MVVVDDIFCFDVNLCTQVDWCEVGECVGGGVDCDDGNFCTSNVCEFAMGCIAEVVDGSCDDGSVCILGDVCGGGIC